MSEQKTLAVTTALALACIAANLHGSISNIVLPFLMSSYIEHFGLSASLAGMLSTAETLVTAACTFLITRRFGSFSSVPVALIAGATIAFGQCMTAFASDNVTLILGRGMVGAGAGVVLAIGNGLIGITANPERTFGIVWSLSLVVEAMLFVLIPYSMADIGYPGFYGLLAITLFVLLFPLFWLQDIPRSEAVGTISGVGSVNPGWYTLFGILFLFAGVGGLWAFFDQIASVKIQMDSRDVGIVLGIGMVFAFMGATCSGVLNVRVGRKRPTFVGLGLLTIVSVSIPLTTSMTLFQIYLLVFLFLVYFLVPYLLGLAATADDQGKFAALGSVMIVLGSAIGPSIGGVLVERAGFETLALLVGVTCVIASVALAFGMGRGLS